MLQHGVMEIKTLYINSLLKQAATLFSMTIRIHQVETWCYTDNAVLYTLLIYTYPSHNTIIQPVKKYFYLNILQKSNDSV